ncbi:MAG: hypothetical protein K2J65_06905 [Duncaniella sp.]|nr:hypothetical protein [Duncaniella sp.]
MNKLESIVYNCVRKNPAIKQFVRNIYQSAFDLLPKKREFFINNYEFRENYFYGFHDCCPWSPDESKILACHNYFDLRMPLPEEKIDIGYFDFNDGKIGNFHKISESTAWNYHKGCRLQWIDNERLIFNSSNCNKLISVIININDHSSIQIPYPIDTIYNDKSELIATSFSYERLERCMPGYGYPYTDEGFCDENIVDNTGLFIINLTTGHRELVASLEKIATISNQPKNDDCIHFVTHSEFSLDGRYVSFLYRRIPRHGNFMKRWTQIIVFDRHTKDISVLPTQDSGSHYVWNTKNQIIASCILNGNSCHALIDVPSNKINIIAQESLNSDGHQSFISDTSFVSDTYPDRRRMAHLYKTDITTDKTTLIASVFSPKDFQTKDFHCHIACDLHPRVSPSGQYVSFDSPRTGKRGLYIMKI